MPGGFLHDARWRRGLGALNGAAPVAEDIPAGQGNEHRGRSQQRPPSRAEGSGPCSCGGLVRLDDVTERHQLDEQVRPAGSLNAAVSSAASKDSSSRKAEMTLCVSVIIFPFARRGSTPGSPAGPSASARPAFRSSARPRRSWPPAYLGQRRRAPPRLPALASLAPLVRGNVPLEVAFGSVRPDRRMGDACLSAICVESRSRSCRRAR